MPNTTERELTDAECDAIYYRRAGEIQLGTRRAVPTGMLRDRDLIRAGWQAAIAAQPAQERDARAYAIEHAGYLADAALHLLGKATELHVSILEEVQEAPDDVREAFSEAYSALENAVYEFRKRRDRAAAQPERARAVPREPTEAMTTAGFASWLDTVGHDEVPGAQTVTQIYQAMYDAAPIATLPDGDTR